MQMTGYASNYADALDRSLLPELGTALCGLRYGTVERRDRVRFDARAGTKGKP